MTTAQIESLITEARARHLWLRSVDRSYVCISPNYAEKAMKVERMAGPDFPNGWVLADAREMTIRRKAHVV